jgi:hypothetical protein
MDRVDVAMAEAWGRVVQLHLGTAYEAADPAAAAQIEEKLQEAERKRKAGTLDKVNFVRWACARVPWLARQLGDVPPPPRRVWAPPPPPVPAPTPAHAAVAARIVRSG